jgi:hypothetical protein
MSYVEQCIGTIMATVGAAAVANLCGTINISADSPCKNLSIICQIVSILKQDTSDHRQTIDGVVDKLIASGSPDKLKDAGLRQTSRDLVLSTLGLSTMLFKPTDTHSSPIVKPAQNNARAEHNGLDIDDIWERPLRTVLTRKRALPLPAPLPKSSNKVTSEKPSSKANDPEALLSANLSFSSLKSIGSMSIEWVDSMDDHLKFDSARRVLSLFQHPVFCAASYLGGPTDSILAK